MIALLRGKIALREMGRAVIDVQGVGYEIYAPQRAVDAWNDEELTVHVSTQVREDAITLYGFATAIDRQAFQVLLGVSGIGPKLALACIDAMPLDKLVRAIEGDDINGLSKISGVGKKTAQRLALELKGKLPVGFVVNTDRVVAPVAGDDLLGLALVKLGYTKSEIERAQRALLDQGIAESAPVPERLKAALAVLYRGDR